ncbi:Structural maintenance of chromosomes protein 2 [Blomia tropicalis]|nr:Structural maintenance of chromosomes protein 2 [Blomia tropicalis]
MFIKKIILDGFKSYGKKVEMTGFDPSFNAITGFNGSGKSNILDAICFVLGLSRMDMARCHQLNELIYKNGQAGVTTASVTIEIDNSDGKFQQLEYQNSKTIVVKREITIKNTSKFLIDGFCVTKEKLLDFFQSVSLNIQNPHFLIMQGKVVKVAGMKPIELLSMVQETVGVSVFETKKKQNLAKVEKLDNDLKEIYTLINDSITPRLNQLKEEERLLIEFRNLSSEYDKMSRILVAYKYLSIKDIVNNSDNLIEDKISCIEQIEESIEGIQKHLTDVTKEMEILQGKLDKEIGGNLKEIESNLNEKRKELDLISANRQLNVDNLKKEQEKMDKLKKSFKNDNDALIKKKSAFEDIQSRYEKLEQENSENETNLAKAEKDFEAITLGLSKGRDGEEAATLTQQLLTSKDQLITIEANLNRSKIQIDNTSEDLKNKKQKVLSDKNSYEKGSWEIENRKKEAEIIQNELNTMNFNVEHYEESKANRTNYKKQYQLLLDQQNQLQAEVPLMKFNYTKPHPHFNDSDVIGVVAELFQVKDPDYALAIEKVCGGKLFNVVVSNEEVGKAILSRGNLREKRTILPLTKMNPKKIRDREMDALRVAERLVGKGNVHYAINLITFDSNLRPAIEHVFGDTMVCPNAQMAKKLILNDNVKKMTVTMEGEIFNPRGIVTGGAVKSGQHTLNIVSQLRNIKYELELMNVRIQQNEEEFQRLNELSKPFFHLKSKLELKNKEINLLEQKLTESDHYTLLKEVEEMETIVKREQDNLKKLEVEKTDLIKHIKELEHKINNSESIRQKERSDAEKHLKLAKKLFENSSKKLQSEQQQFESLTQEIKHFDDILATLQSKIDTLQSEMDLIQVEINKFNAESESFTEQIHILETEYNDYRKTLNEKSKEIKNLSKKQEEFSNSICENENKVKNLKLEIEDIKTKKKDAGHQLKSILNKYAWIVDEERDFNSPDSEYRVLHHNFNLDEFQDRMSAIKSKKASLSKSVNMKANIMHGEKQKELDDLLKKSDTLVQDRNKVLEHIDDAEKRKDTELRKAWKKVNESFGHIFSTLLPNSFCKLVPVNGRTINDGFEIKVSFGSVWKESLSELSGGQRSLVALSLVLALLKYNPAPLYILDEVDAALDQSHTTNIGVMIKRHFKNSQFIVVSLKDDMFNNANVLFQTRFIDGFSTVERR